MRAVTLLFHDVYSTDPVESGFRSDAADRYKLSREAFEAQLDGVARARRDAPIVVSNVTGLNRLLPTPATAHEPAPLLPFLITVDDGGVSYHSAIADALEARGWRGHCFVSTDFIATRGFLSKAQIRELDARGHVIGSHSASHPQRFSACTFERMVAEWSSSRQVLEDILGHSVDVASVPGGYFSRTVARAAHEAGIRVLFTSEPVTSIEHGADVVLIGRYTIRRGDAPDAARRLVVDSSWTRSAAWLSWNAKGLVKPLLGPSYMRVADWVHAVRRPVSS